MYSKDECLFCSCHHRQRYCIDCALIFHVLSQAKEFVEPNHHHISVRWWNNYYQIACLSSKNIQFDESEKAVKMMMLIEKEGLPVKLEWFNHLPIYHNKNLPIEFKNKIFQNVLITQISR